MRLIDFKLNQETIFMQTRKRAKTITFGKTEKPKEDAVQTSKKEELKIEEPKKETVTAHPEQSTPGLSHAAKKVVEEVNPVEEQKEVDDEVPTVPEVPKEKEAEEVLTPADQFLSDSPGPSSPDVIVPKEDKSNAPMVLEPLSTPSATPESTVPAIPEQKPAEPGFSPELSPTPPSSAFTIQENNNVVASSGETKKKNFVLYFIVVAFISFALGLGAMAAVSHFGLLPKNLPNISLNSNVLKNMNPLKPTPTPVATVVPTTVPTAKPLDLKAYTISVLNGSGVVGKAAEVKTTLTTAGFKVGTTGNADRSDYTTTQIAAKKTVDQAYLDKLQTELKKSYSLEPVSTLPSDSAESADIIVTLGKTAAH
jgi:hypothetical protein